MKDKRRVNRRAFLETAGTTALALALLNASPREAIGKQCNGRSVTVFRLRTRNTRSCAACGVHHRYKVFISYAHADRNRAHPGCNCPIVRQKISLEAWRLFFLERGSIRTGVFDLRSLTRRDLLQVKG